MEKKTTEKQKVSVKKQQWKPGNMLYPLPAVLVSLGREGEKPNLILDPAGFHRNDPVTAHLVNAGDDISPSVPVKNCMDFVPIVIGLLHSFDGMDGADPLKKFFYRLLFFLQLFLVVHALILAASAFFRHRAEIFGSVLHRFVPLILRPEALLRYLWFAGR